MLEENRDIKKQGDMLMDYKEEYSKILAEEKVIQEKKKKILQQYVAENCPLKIGDIITICGWIYKGKQGKITDIIAKFGFEEELTWKVYGNVLRSDGTVGKNSFEFEESHYKEWINDRRK